MSKIQYAELLETSHDQLADSLRKFHSRVKKWTKTRENIANDTPETAKVMAAFKQQYATKQHNGEIDKAQSFACYYKSVFGDKPNGKVEQSSIAFSTFVLSEKITEEDFDLCAADWLQKAGTISNSLKGDLKHPMMDEVASVLHKRPNDGAKQLRKMVATLKGETTDVNGKKYTADDVAEQVSKFLQDGYGTMVMTCVRTFIKDRAEWSGEKDLKDLFLSFLQMTKQWDASIIADTQSDWTDEWIASQQSEIKVQAMPDFVAFTKVYWPKMKKDERDAAAEGIKEFYLTEKRLPNNPDELEQFFEEHQAETAAA